MGVDIQSFGETDRQTDRQTETDRQTDRQTDRDRVENLIFWVPHKQILNLVLPGFYFFLCILHSGNRLTTEKQNSSHTKIIS